MGWLHHRLPEVYPHLLPGLATLTRRALLGGASDPCVHWVGALPAPCPHVKTYLELRDDFQLSFEICPYVVPSEGRALSMQRQACKDLKMIHNDICCIHHHCEILGKTEVASPLSEMRPMIPGKNPEYVLESRSVLFWRVFDTLEFRTVVLRHVGLTDWSSELTYCCVCA